MTYCITFVLDFWDSIGNLILETCHIIAVVLFIVDSGNDLAQASRVDSTLLVLRHWADVQAIA